MITISLWQPWASAIALGLKRFETRSWAAQCVGQRIAIHAAKRNTPEVRRWWMENVKCGGEAEHADVSRHAFAQAGIHDWCDLPLGAIVCTCDLVAVHPTAPLVERGGVSPLECVWGNFTPERYAWELANVIPLKTPAPAKGWQNFFTWDPATNMTIGLPPACRGRVTA